MQARLQETDRGKLVAAEQESYFRAYRIHRYLWSTALFGMVLLFGVVAPLLAFTLGVDPLRLGRGLQDPVQSAAYAGILTIGLGAGISVLVDGMTRRRVMIFERGVALAKGKFRAKKDEFLFFSDVRRIRFVGTGGAQFLDLQTADGVVQLSLSALETTEAASAWLRRLPQASDT